MNLPTTKRVARVRFTYEELTRLLNLRVGDQPHPVTVVGMEPQRAEEQVDETVIFVVAGEGLPVKAEGSSIPYVFFNVADKQASE